MERNPAAGQLMEAPSAGRLAFSWASPADDAEMRGLLGRVPMDGAVRIGFSREPSYFACPNPAGAIERTLLARLDGKLACLGALSEREVWLEGRATRVGYLGGLRMAPGVREAPRVLREGYARFAEYARASDAEAWFTSIASDNLRARRVLESRRLGLPDYTPITDLVTGVFPVKRRVKREQQAETPEDREELDAFLNREAERFQLGLTWNAARWDALARDGFGLRQMRVIRRSGRIVAAAGVWNQSKWKQVTVHGYVTWLKRLRPLINLASWCRGTPGLPPAGQMIPMASVFPFAVDSREISALPELWTGIEAAARGMGVYRLALGLDATDPLLEILSRRGGVHRYRTTLYSVAGAGIPAESVGWKNRGFRPEIAML